ncbi:MAG TPA: Xaa-Pro peptidase family protein [Chloroflexota bacterium]|jgi:Xaa-Pro aminopeptidase
MPLAERDRRWAELRRRMADAALDLLLVFGESGMSDVRTMNLHYLSLIGGNGEEAWLAFPREGPPTAFVWSGGSMLDEWRDRGVWVDDLRPCPGARWSGSLVAYVRELGLARERIGLVGLPGQLDAEGIIPHVTYERLQAGLPEAELANATALLEAMRLVKSPAELEFIAAAVAIGDAAWATLRREAVPGANEYQVFARTFATLLEHGSEQPIVVFWDSGPAVSHSRRLPARRTLAAGDVILTELCPRYFGYWANFQAPAVVGPPTPEYREIFAIARAAFENGYRAMRPGITLRALSEALLAPIQDAGCTSLHVLAQGTGHGPWEEPLVRAPRRVAEEDAAGRAAREREMDLVLREGMVLALQPHVTRDLRRGVRLGDPVVVTADGARRLSCTPLDVCAAAAAD